MPLYEYQCKKCQRIQETSHKISERIKVNCSYCTTPMQKVISKSTFVLKGTGWYATDNRKKETKVETSLE